MIGPLWKVRGLVVSWGVGLKVEIDSNGHTMSIVWMNMVDILIMAMVVLGTVQANEILAEVLGGTFAAMALKREQTQQAYVPLPLVFSTYAQILEAIVRVQQPSHCREATSRRKG